MGPDTWYTSSLTVAKMFENELFLLFCELQFGEKRSYPVVVPCGIYTTLSANSNEHVIYAVPTACVILTFFNT